MLTAGIMSGTSLDGIDVALVEISGEGFSLKVHPVAFRHAPYPREAAQALLAVSNAETHTARIAQLHFLLGELYGEAVVDACRSEGIPLERLELVGSHGQTIYHQGAPGSVCGRRLACTLQIGEPALIADKTKTPVVADFRPADMAAGGQGAPLVPYVDYLLYRDAQVNRAALNIGGIANITCSFGTNFEVKKPKNETTSVVHQRKLFPDKHDTSRVKHRHKSSIVD